MKQTLFVCHTSLACSSRAKPHLYQAVCFLPTTNFLTATTSIYAIGAGITAAAGTRLALQWFLRSFFRAPSLQLQKHCPALLCFVTTSLIQEWVICAPAATLRCWSRFSCSISGIEP